MKRIIFFLISLISVLHSTAQTAGPMAYRLFNNKGQTVTFAEVVKDLREADVVFVGEIHNCVMTHWLELRLLTALHAEAQAKHRPFSVGMEMFEADNQLIINEFMQGIISSSRFENECRLWPNYSTDYEPLVSYARTNHLPLIATNVPRRYASVVKERGLAYLDSLSAEAKSYLPPLPICYVNNKEAQAGFGLMAMMGGADAAKANTAFMAQAQAIKDATMAHNIALRLAKGEQLVHFNGSYHSDAMNGIIPYLLQARKGTKVATIRAVRQECTEQLDSTYLGLANYYMCIPEDMPMSY